MKKTSFKLFALALAICCIVTLIPLITFAATSSGALGHVYTKEDDSILLGTDLTTNSSEFVEPGENVYVVIRKIESNTLKNKVKSMKITAGDSDSKLVVANQTLSETIILKDTAGERYECAVVPVKSIAISKFKEENYFSYNGELVVKFKNGSNVTAIDDMEIDVSFNAGYSENQQDDITKVAKKFEFEKDDEITFVYDGNDGNELEIDTEFTADTIAILSCDNDSLDEIEDLFGNFAELTYYNLHGNLNRVKNTKLTIYNVEDMGKYLYRYQGGVLYDMSYCYKGEEDDTFEVRISGTSVELCSYIVSNYALDLSKSPILEGSETVIYEEPTDPDTTRADVVIPNSTIPIIYGKIDDSQTTSRVTPAIPNTGAVC